MRRIGIVPGHASNRDRQGLDTFANHHVLDKGIPVEAVVEGLADVEVREEVGRDTVAVQLAGTDILVAFDIEVEEHIGVANGGQSHITTDRPAAVTHRRAGIEVTGIRVVLAFLAYQRVHLCIISLGTDNQAIGITGCEHSKAGAKLIHCLDNHTLDSGGITPVVVITGQHVLLTYSPVIQFVGSGTVDKGGERILFGGHGVVILPGITGTIPTAVLGYPRLVHDAAPVIGDGGQEGAPGLCQGHGNGASCVISYDCSLNLLTSCHEGSRVEGRQGCAIIGDSASRINYQGDVIGANAEERLS